MKKFYYRKSEGRKLYYGGRKFNVEVFTVKKGELIKLGSLTWNTASYRGDESAVNEWLIENKFIPKTWSKSEYGFEERRKYRGVYWTPYYHRNSKYCIQEV